MICFLSLFWQSETVVQTKRRHLSCLTRQSAASKYLNNLILRQFQSEEKNLVQWTPTCGLYSQRQEAPQCKGTSETITRNVQFYNIRVIHKPITSYKYKITKLLIQNYLYKITYTKLILRSGTNLVTDGQCLIKCWNCQATYTGVSGGTYPCMNTAIPRCYRYMNLDVYIQILMYMAKSWCNTSPTLTPYKSHNQKEECIYSK